MAGPRLGPPSRDCTVVELDGRISVHCPATGEVQLLDHTATNVWRLLDGTRTLRDVLHDLGQAYGVAPEELRHDVERLVEQLMRAGALPREPGGRS